MAQVLEYLARTQTAQDDFVGAPSGLGYIYPSTWPTAALRDFATLTGEFMNTTSAVLDRPMSVVNVIGDPCVGGTYIPNCKGLTAPNVSALLPILSQPNVRGLLFFRVYAHVIPHKLSR